MAEIEKTKDMENCSNNQDDVSTHQQSDMENMDTKIKDNNFAPATNGENKTQERNPHRKEQNDITLNERIHPYDNDTPILQSFKCSSSKQVRFIFLLYCV